MAKKHGHKSNRSSAADASGQSSQKGPQAATPLTPELSASARAYALEKAARMLAQGRNVDADQLLHRVWPTDAGLSVAAERIGWLLSAHPPGAVQALAGLPLEERASDLVLSSLSDAVLGLEDEEFEAIASIPGLTDAWASQAQQARQCLQLLANGEDDAALAIVKTLARYRPWASVVLFLRGLHATYADSPQQANELWGRLPTDGGLARAAQFAQSQITSASTPPLHAVWQALKDEHPNQAISAAASCYAKLDAGNRLLLLRELPPALESLGVEPDSVLSRLRKGLPELLQGLDGRIVEAHLGDTASRMRGGTSWATLANDVLVHLPRGHEWAARALDRFASGYADHHVDAVGTVAAIMAEHGNMAGGHKYFRQHGGFGQVPYDDADDPFCMMFLAALAPQLKVAVPPSILDPFQFTSSDERISFGQALVGAIETRILDLCRRALQLDPHYEQGWKSYLRHCQRFGGKKLVTDAREGFAKACPESPEGSIAAALACLDRGSFDKGLKFLTKVLQSQPFNRALRDLEAKLLGGKAVKVATSGVSGWQQKSSALFDQALAVPHVSIDVRVENLGMAYYWEQVSGAHAGRLHKLRSIAHLDLARPWQFVAQVALASEKESDSTSQRRSSNAKVVSPKAVFVGELPPFSADDARALIGMHDRYDDADAPEYADIVADCIAQGCRANIPELPTERDWSKLLSLLFELDHKIRCAAAKRAQTKFPKNARFVLHRYSAALDLRHPVEEFSTAKQEIQALLDELDDEETGGYARNDEYLHGMLCDCYPRAGLRALLKRIDRHLDSLAYMNRTETSGTMPATKQSKKQGKVPSVSPTTPTQQMPLFPDKRDPK